MKLKKFIQNSFFYPFLVQARYLIHRYICNRQFRPYCLAPDAQIKQIGSKISFFGYYNISPTNEDGDILFLEVETETPRASMAEPANIMLTTSKGETRQIATTAAWNWQQGCMLQWMPGDSGHILFNDYDPATDQYIAKVIDKSGNLVSKYNIPVTNVSKCGTFALSLNYDRLAKMRPDYGYFNRKDQTLPPDDEDGVWYLDLKTGDFRLIVSLDTLKNLKYTSTMEGAEHKVNHIDINPDGSRFMFLHRWMGHQGRFMRLITADPDGSNLYILNGDVMTSHCCWANSHEIISYCDYNRKRDYFKFKDKTQKVSFLSVKMPKVDGHPSISPDGRWLVTDTYPDKSRMSHLYAHNMNTEEITHLGRFYQPFKYKKEMRIDLHPKWSKDGKQVFFESGHSGRRQLYSIQYEKLENFEGSNFFRTIMGPCRPAPKI
jgi:hypothetical protein